MLIHFSVSNAFSFKERVDLNLTATSISEFESSNLADVGPYRVLLAAVIFGANASGKSNLIKAMGLMRHLVLNSSKLNSTDKLPYEPFLLSETTSGKPSLYEIGVRIDGTQYRYGFTADQNEVHTEWLYFSKIRAEKPLFLRDKDGIEVFRNFPEGKGLEERTRPNELFLAKCDTNNGSVSGRLMLWINNLNIISALPHQVNVQETVDMLPDEESRKRLFSFFKKLDLGFNAVQIREGKLESVEFPASIPQAVREFFIEDLRTKKMVNVATAHNRYAEDGSVIGQIYLDLGRQESTGTIKMFSLAARLLRVLAYGGVIVIDELDASVHPVLTLELCKLFHSSETNPKNAQLIMTTHDTNLLSKGKFRRDQIYFMEKNRVEASQLYSLVQFKEEGRSVRADRSYEKDYLNGRYGGVPIIASEELADA
jgi:predicted ATPase